MASIIDVAKRAGVSKSTVSRYFNHGYVSEECAKRIKEAVEGLSYTPSSLGRALRYRRTMTIGLCIPRISHPLFSRLAEAVEGEAYRLGYRLLITDSGNDRSREESFISLVRKNQIDGIIFVTHNIYESMDPNLPIVAIDRRFPGVPTITSDNYGSTERALSYLWSSGARRIGFLGSRPSVSCFVEERYRAYEDFADRIGMRKRVGYYDSRIGEEEIYSRRFLEDFPDIDAVFATSDTYGLACYSLLARSGRSTEDVKILTYDGCLADFVPSPRFTSIQQDIPQMARVAVEALDARITGKSGIRDVYTVPTEFMKGETA